MLNEGYNHKTLGHGARQFHAQSPLGDLSLENQGPLIPKTFNNYLSRGFNAESLE